MLREQPLISIVVPVYLSEDTVDELVARLCKNLSFISDSFEIILIDDGSKDGSWKKIRENCAKEKRVKGFRLSRNFGQHPAITAGIEASSGEWVIVMDCDLQDRPEEIAALYSKAKEGHDIVLASRVKRKDSFQKKLFSKFFYKTLSFLSGTKYDYTVANFGIYHRSVIDSILRMQESIRYFPSMVNWVGYERISIPVEHSDRFAGKTSYNFKKQMKLAIDIILAHSDKPLKIIIGLGISISLISFLFSLFTIYRALKGHIQILGYASLIISISFFSGIIISVLGVLGLYIGKIFETTKKRPIYLIKDRLNENPDSL